MPKIVPGGVTELTPRSDIRAPPTHLIEWRALEISVPKIRKRRQLAPFWEVRLNTRVWTGGIGLAAPTPPRTELKSRPQLLPRPTGAARVLQLRSPLSDART